MSGGSIIAQAFGEGANLYTDVLGLSDVEDTTTITPAQLRKAYYKRALAYHPDKQDASSSTPDQKNLAKLKFQAISVAYTILSDPEKRREYDESGEMNDESYDADFGHANSTGVEMWSEYFRGIFGVVTTKDIDRFSMQYKCSDEEHADVLKYYTMFRGDLNKMLECVMCSSELDKKRWVEDYILPAINEGKVNDFMDKVNHSLDIDVDVDMGENEHELDEGETTETDEEDRVEATETKTVSASKLPQKQKKSRNKAKNNLPAGKKSPKRKEPSVKHKAEQKQTKSKSTSSTGDDDLFAAIRGNAVARREEAFDNLMAGLEARYGGSKSKKKKKGGEDEPDIPDDEFEKIRSKLIEGRNGKSSSNRKK